MLDTYKMLTDEFADEWLGWEPETLQVVKDRKLPNLNIEKAVAIQVLLNTDAVYTEPFAFEKWVLLANDYPVNFRQFQDISPIDILDAIDIMEQIHHRDEFGDEVLELIAEVFKDNGIMGFPKGIFKPDELKELEEYIND